MAALQQLWDACRAVEAEIHELKAAAAVAAQSHAQLDQTSLARHSEEQLRSREESLAVREAALEQRARELEERSRLLDERERLLNQQEAERKIQMPKLDGYDDAASSPMLDNKEHATTDQATSRDESNDASGLTTSEASATPNSVDDHSRTATHMTASEDHTAQQRDSVSSWSATPATSVESTTSIVTTGDTADSDRASSQSQVEPTEEESVNGPLSSGSAASLFASAPPMSSAATTDLLRGPAAQSVAPSFSVSPTSDPATQTAGVFSTPPSHAQEIDTSSFAATLFSNSGSHFGASSANPPSTAAVLPASTMTQPSQDVFPQSQTQTGSFAASMFAQPTQTYSSAIGHTPSNMSQPGPASIMPHHSEMTSTSQTPPQGVSAGQSGASTPSRLTGLFSTIVAAANDAITQLGTTQASEQAGGAAAHMPTATSAAGSQAGAAQEPPSNSDGSGFEFDDLGMPFNGPAVEEDSFVGADMLDEDFTPSAASLFASSVASSSVTSHHHHQPHHHQQQQQQQQQQHDASSSDKSASTSADLSEATLVVPSSQDMTHAQDGGSHNTSLQTVDLNASQPGMPQLSDGLPVVSGSPAAPPAGVTEGAVQGNMSVGFGSVTLPTSNQAPPAQPPAAGAFVASSAPTEVDLAAASGTQTPPTSEPSIHLHEMKLGSVSQEERNRLRGWNDPPTALGAPSSASVGSSSRSRGRRWSHKQFREAEAVPFSTDNQGQPIHPGVMASQTAAGPSQDALKQASTAASEAVSNINAFSSTATPHLSSVQSKKLADLVNKLQTLPSAAEQGRVSLEFVQSVQAVAQRLGSNDVNGAQAQMQALAAAATSVPSRTQDETSAFVSVKGLVGLARQVQNRMARA